MTDAVLRRCPACGRYGLHAACPVCGTPTISPHPARYSPQDRYARYRRALYEEVARTAAGAPSPAREP